MHMVTLVHALIYCGNFNDAYIQLDTQHVHKGIYDWQLAKQCWIYIV